MKRPTQRAYTVEENSFGYMLSSGAEKLVLYRSKIHAAADWYLKQVEPMENYLSGLFYDKRRRLFRGKTRDGFTIFVRIIGASGVVYGL